MSGPATDPKGLDRTTALPIKKTGTDKAPVFRVYNPSGRLIGAFSTQADAERFRDTVPLDLAISAGKNG